MDNNDETETKIIGKYFLSISEAFESKIRMAIIAGLFSGDKDWSDLKALTGTSDGNLSTHLAKLESIDYIYVNKKFLKKRPNTTYCLTSKAIREFTEYVNMLVGLINIKH